RLAVASLRVVLSAAVEDGVLASNPAAKVGQFVQTEKPERQAIAMEGEPLRARLVQETCTRVLADARMRKFRFHDLRHTFGSLLIEEGAPLPYVRDQMGHSSIQMTADKYVHLIARRNVRFIDRLDTATSPQQSATQAQPIKKHPVQNGSGPHPQVIDRKGWCERGEIGRASCR